MKSIKFALLVSTFSLLLSSCVEVDLVDVALSALPESSGTYCDNINTDSSYDPLLWESVISMDSSLIFNPSKPIIYRNQVIVFNEKDNALSFDIFNKDTGELLLNKLTTIDSRFIKSVRLFDDLILIANYNTVTAINADDISVAWQINIDGSIYEEYDFVISDNKILLPIKVNNSSEYIVELLKIDLTNGSVTEKEEIYSSPISNTRILNINSFEFDSNSKNVLISMVASDTNNLKYHLVVSKNITTSNLNWQWRRDLNSFNKIKAIHTNSYAVIVLDSVYVLDPNDGMQISSQVVENFNNSGSFTPTIKANGDQFFIKFSWGHRKLIDLPSMNIIWSEDSDRFFDYRHGVQLESDYYTAHDNVLKRINIETGLSESWSEMPRTCSYLSDNINIDPVNRVLYFTDKKRLYAMQLD